MSVHVAAETPDQNEAFDLASMGAGWSQTLKEKDLDTKGQGRPASSKRSAKPSPEPAAPSVGYSGKELAPIIRTTLDPACRLADVSKLTEDEVTALSEAAAPVFTKYAGAMSDKPEFFLLLTAGVIATPRVLEYVGKRQARKDEPVDAPEGGVASKITKNF